MLFADKKRCLLLVLALLPLAGLRSGAQVELTEPRLRLNTGGHVGAVHSLLFTPDQKLISCGLDKVVRVNKLALIDSPITMTTEPSAWRYKIGDGFIGQFFAAALNPNPKRPHQLALGSSGSGLSNSGKDNDSDILLTDYETGAQTNRLKAHKGTITGLAFAPNGKGDLLASCATDGKVLLWDTTAPKPVPQTLLNIKGEYVAGVAFSPDGQWLASASWRADEDEHIGVVRVWQLDAKHHAKSAREFSWHNDIQCVAWSKAGVLAYGSVDGVIHLRDANHNFAEMLPLTVQNDSIFCLAFNPDGSRLLSGGGREGRDVTVRVWSRNENQEFAQTQKFNRHFTTVHSVTFSSDGTQAASGDAFGAVYVWPIRNDAPFVDVDDKARAFKGSGSPVFSVAWSQAGDKIGWGNVFGRPTLQHIFDLTNAAPVIIAPGESSAWHFAQTYWANPKQPHNWLVLQALPDASGVLARDNQGREVQRIRLDAADKLHCWGFTPDGKIVLGSDLYLSCYELSGHSARKECNFEGHEGPVLAISVSPDGRYLASGGVDQTVRLWNLHPASESAESLAWDKNASDPVATIAPARSGARQVVDAPALVSGRPESKTRSIGSLLGIFEDERGAWAAWAQKGYYAASAAGDDLLGWQINRGETNAAEFRTSRLCQEIFYQPEIIQQVAAKGGLNEALAAVFKGAIPPGLDTPIQQRITRVPDLIKVRVEANGVPLSPNPDGTYTTQAKEITAYCSFKDLDPNLAINAELNHAGGARPYTPKDVGRISSTNNVGGTRGWSKCEYISQTKEWKVSVPNLEAGKNDVNISATNNSGTSDIPLNITYASPTPEPGILRVFAIGISNYNSGQNLKYADEDAKAILKFFHDNGKSLFKDVEDKYSLLNEKATHARIEDELEQLAKDVKPQDTVLLFFACHGFTAADVNGEKFYLAPTDTNFDQRNNPKNGLAWTEIIEDLKKIQARHIVLMVDHCFAGGVNETLLQTAVGPRAQTQAQTLHDMYNKNILVFAASGPTEFSYEDPKLGHGVFTAAILKALQGDMEASLYPDGKATLDAMDFWVPREVARLNSGQSRVQHPSLFALPQADKAVPLAKVNTLDKK